MRPTIRVRRLPHATDLPLPAYATEGAAGMDLRAWPQCQGFAGSGMVMLPGCTAIVACGFEIEIAPWHVGFVCPRSGLASKHGVTVLNAPGVIDSDYRGEVRVLLVNHGRHDYTVRRGDRIAQLVIAPVSRAILVEVEELGDTARGAGGFGSTGR